MVTLASEMFTKNPPSGSLIRIELTKYTHQKDTYTTVLQLHLKYVIKQCDLQLLGFFLDSMSFGRLFLLGGSSPSISPPVVNALKNILYSRTKQV